MYRAMLQPALGAGNSQHDTEEARFYIRGQDIDSRLIHKLKNGFRVHKRDACCCIIDGANDDIAGQQKSDFWLGANETVPCL